MRPFDVAGRTVATAATVDHGVAALWNPHAAVRVVVHEISLCTAAAGATGATVRVRRISARGTPGTSVSLTIANDSERLLAPPSGSVLDLATYTAQPTFDGPPVDGWVLAGVAGAGIRFLFPKGIVIPAGAGLALCTGAAVAVVASDVSFHGIE